MRSLKLEGSMFRACEDAGHQQAERGKGQEKRGQRARVVHIGKNISLCTGCMCVHSRRPDLRAQESWDTWEEETITDQASAWEPRASSDDPGPVHHFSVLRAKF